MTRREPAASGPREVELKLRVPAEALPQLEECPALREHARSPLQKTRLLGTYYDTVDGRLAMAGLTLRVRQAGERYVQTLKGASDGPGVVADRAEWEVELPGPSPDLAAFADPAVIERTGLEPGAALVPRFTTRIERDTVTLDWPDGRDRSACIEVAIDRGEIVAGERVLPVAEVELELKDGQPATLFGLAETLRAVAPLAIEPLPKAARGQLLASGEAPRGVKAGKLRLAPDLGVEAGMAAIFRYGLGHLLRNEAAARDGRDPEGLHQVRVALRRLRSALAIFKGILPEADRERWQGELRWTLGELGPARDLDVFLGSTLPALEADAALHERLAGLHQVAAAARDAAYEQVRATLASRRWADLVLGLAAWIERAGWRQGLDVDRLVALGGPLRGLAADLLAERHAKVRKKGRRFAELDPPGRHKVRIAVKKLRYGVEFFTGLFEGKAARRYAERLAGLQEELGHYNDVTVATRLVDRLLEPLPAGPSREQALAGAGIVIGAHAAKAPSLEPALRKGWKRFARAEPFWTDGDG